jgi:DNA-binding SARP family transcriptional activator
MKHGFVEEMENIFDEDKKISHTELAKKVSDRYECRVYIYILLILFL